MIKIRSLRVVKKRKYDESLSCPSFFYGVEIYDDVSKEKFYPTYPFSAGKCDLESLIDFVFLYEKDLLDFYKNGHNYDFGSFLFGVGTDMKNKFRDSWFGRGVIIY